MTATGHVTPAPSSTPGHRGTLRVLYVFAGSHRQCSVAHYLLEIVKDCTIEEVDILQRPVGGDMLAKQNREQLLEKIRSGTYDAAVWSPPCNTFSRLPYRNKKGPPPLRSAAYVRGFPVARGGQPQKYR